MMQLRKQAFCLRRFTPSVLLLIGLAQFVPLQISKIEPNLCRRSLSRDHHPGATKSISVNAGGDVATCVHDEAKLAGHQAVTPVAAIPEAAADSRANS